MRLVTLFQASAAGVMLSLGPSSWAGPVWDEITSGGGDAGALIATSQHTVGTGPIVSISGSLHADQGDHQDMYKIKVNPGTSQLKIKTTTVAGVAGLSSFDTVLWLFDSAGFGLLANHDLTGGGGGVGSEIVFLAPPAGDYYIAITAFGDDALSSGGSIFTIVGNKTSGPDGPGGAFPLTGWLGTSVSGSYVMHLEGASAGDVPAPAGGAVLALSAIGGRRRRRA